MSERNEAMNEKKKYRGLTSDYIRELSARKKEPKWMLELRLSGLSYWEKLEMPAWAPDITELKLDDILMYVEPKKEMVGSWDEVPAEIRETFEQLGIPEAEREHLAGVGAQYDSEVIYHNLKEQIAKKGVVYLPMEEAVATTQKPREEVIRQYGVDVAEILKKHFMKLISESDHKFTAACKAANLFLNLTINLRLCMRQFGVVVRLFMYPKMSV